MSEASNIPFQAVRPEAAFAAIQNSAACWSRAVSHLTSGFMAAAKAQGALASEVFKVEPNGWLKSVTPDNAAEAAREWLAGQKARQETLLQGFRQINDDLAACLFTVADDLADGLTFGNGTADPASAPKRESVKAAAAEKKQVA